MKKYPTREITIGVAVTFTFFYFLSYLVSSITYALIWRTPADMSGNVSWIHYGLVFSILPYLMLGFFMAKFNLKGANKNKLFVHVIAETFIVEKIIYVGIASLLAKLWDSQTAGTRLLCEELPFFCQPFINKYLVLSVIVGAIFYYLGCLIEKKVNRSCTDVYR
ncbi:hypothetical protein ACP26L_15850 [Paenibacillus sp. S-38]|uniref:hypothetical protein n=1 Tax=Paenibacillus sp. S-38 TaxID=3416710 RepID=UPI003CEF48C7